MKGGAEHQTLGLGNERLTLFLLSGLMLGGRTTGGGGGGTAGPERRKSAEFIIVAVVTCVRARLRERESNVRVSIQFALSFPYDSPTLLPSIEGTRLSPSSSSS